MIQTANPNDVSVQSLYYQLRARVRTQGVETYDEYIDMVEELLQEKLGYGFFDKHDDMAQIQKDLEMMWPEIEKGKTDARF